MTCGPEIPERERVRVVLMQRTGLGWCVGIGFMVSGRIDEDRMAFLTEREARGAALALSDLRDLMVVRSEAAPPAVRDA